MGFGYYPYIIPSGINPDIYTSDGNLILQLDYVAGVSSIKGQVATGTDVNIYANSTDSYPYLRLHGAGETEISHAIGSYFKIFDGTTQALKTTYATNVTTIEGGGVSGDDLIFKCNSVDTYPYIKLDLNYETHTALSQGMTFFQAGVYYGAIISEPVNNQMKFASAITNYDLFLQTNGTGVLKFGLEITNAGNDRGKLVKFKLTNGTSVYIKTYDTV